MTSIASSGVRKRCKTKQVNSCLHIAQYIIRWHIFKWSSCLGRLHSAFHPTRPCCRLTSQEWIALGSSVTTASKQLVSVIWAKLCTVDDVTTGFFKPLQCITLLGCCIVGHIGPNKVYDTFVLLYSGCMHTCMNARQTTVEGSYYLPCMHITPCSCPCPCTLRHAHVHVDLHAFTKP